VGAKKSHQQFIEEIVEKEIQVEVLEKYVDSRTKISCKCKKCGLVWECRKEKDKNFCLDGTKKTMARYPHLLTRTKTPRTPVNQGFSGS